MLWAVDQKHHVTRHNTPIHNILLTAPQLSIPQKALGMLPEDGNVMPKHVLALQNPSLYQINSTVSRGVAGWGGRPVVWHPWAEKSKWKQN
jgi:hypothetical protein